MYANNPINCICNVLTDNGIEHMLGIRNCNYIFLMSMKIEAREITLAALSRSYSLHIVLARVTFLGIKLGYDKLMRKWVVCGDMLLAEN